MKRFERFPWLYSGAGGEVMLNRDLNMYYPHSMRSRLVDLQLGSRITTSKTLTEAEWNGGERWRKEGKGRRR